MTNCEGRNKNVLEHGGMCVHVRVCVCVCVCVCACMCVVEMVMEDKIDPFGTELCTYTLSDYELHYAVTVDFTTLSNTQWNIIRTCTGSIYSCSCIPSYLH